MNKFSITFVDPFIREEQNIEVLDETQIINEFSKIPWYENIMDCFYEETTATRPPGYIEKKGRSMIENHHWYFWIELNYLGDRKVLTIVPNYATKMTLEEKDMLFSIEYVRPKKEKTSKLAQFFGAKPEKINSEYFTHLRDITYDEILKIITLFSKEKTEFLEENINVPGGLYD